ncbi:MAG: hypothetical protein ACJ74J_17235 [Blastocatellia bacterium]
MKTLIRASSAMARLAIQLSNPYSRQPGSLPRSSPLASTLSGKRTPNGRGLRLIAAILTQLCATNVQQGLCAGGAIKPAQNFILRSFLHLAKKPGCAKVCAHRLNR